MMPVVFREGGFRFHFYSGEGDPREPVHIHAARPGGDAKLWLYPEVRVAYNRRLTSRELRELQEIVTRRRQEIEDAWNAFFS
jgi:hypothetical protein